MKERHETPESRSYRRDLENLQKHQDKAWEMFQRLLKRTEKMAQSVRKEFPDEALQRRVFMKNLQGYGPAIRFLNTYVGTEQQSPKAKSWRRRALYQLRNLHFDPDYTLSEAERIIRQVAAQGYQSIELHKGQAPLKILPGEILELLPKNIVVQVDEDGRITKMTTRFSNAHENLAKKIAKMRELAERYNEIVAKVKRDLKNPDELTKLSALITAIVMETGIRPGKIGQGFTKVIDGEELTIDTFGAITLGPSHVKFIRDNFAELSFPGKKGTVNIASLTDPQVIKLLKTYVDKALSSDVPFIFVTADGEQYGYKHFQRYFRTKVLSGIAPSDFRKLKATQAVLDHLKAEQEALYERVKQFAESEIDNLKERVVEEIVKVIQEAYAKATQTLSHDEAKTAIEQYINPEVILRFLSQGQIEDDLRKAILENKPYLSFDPDVFIEKAIAKRAFVSLEAFQRYLYASAPVVELKSPEQKQQAAQLEKTILREASDLSHRMFGIYENGELVAMLRANTNPLEDWTLDDAYDDLSALRPQVGISATVVSPAHRGKGYALALREHLKRIYSSILTSTDPKSHAAIKVLNERQGFVPVLQRSYVTVYHWSRGKSLQASLNEDLEFLREKAFDGINWKSDPKPFVELIMRNRDSKPIMDYARTHFGDDLVEFRYTRLNLRGLNLEGESIHGADFGGSDLRDAKLDHATFYDTWFRETNLQGASLNNITSRGGFFFQANLQGASLVGAVLTGANLVGANLLRADARETDLQNAVMERADLEHADFRNSDLRNVNLRNADLTNADFRDADLRFADLFGANHLFMADLRGAQLPDLGRQS